jgi:anti-sigma regulatory factor (Ser/Thr protein kinase)
VGEGQHVGFTLRTATDLDTVARTVLHDLAGLPGVSRAGLALSEGGGRRLRFLASDSEGWCHIDAYDDVPLTSVVRSGQPLLGALGDFGGRFAGMVERQRAAGTRAIAVLPLTGPVATIGGLIVYYDEHQAFTAPQRRSLAAAARRTCEAVQRVRTARFGAPVQVAELADEGKVGASLVLDDDPRAAGEARRFLRDVLTAWDVGGDQGEIAELCLSELVTNAVIHAGTTSVVIVTVGDDDLTVAVRDSGGAGATPTVLESDDPLEVFGRGLQLVDTLADSWGSQNDSDGTTAWFSLGLPHGDRSQRTG